MLTRKKIENAPFSPGVYYLKNKKGNIVYIGKAAQLKKRLTSYLKAEQENPRLKELIRQAYKVSWKITPTEIEALLLESQEIKKSQPFFNILLKDDKQYFYVIFTQDIFPRVKITHQPDKEQFIKKIGPFTSGPALRKTLRVIRKVIPFCTCKDYHNHNCVNSQLGLCPGYCCLKKTLIAKNLRQKQKEYQKILQNLEQLLKGKIIKVKNNLKKEMKEASQREDFEKAEVIREKIEAFNNILLHQHIINQEIYKKAFQIKNKQTFLKILNVKKCPLVWEAYDISNLKGLFATGSMVTFLMKEKKNTLDYFAYKKNYRIFNIKTVPKSNDIKMIKEVLKRRVRHLNKDNRNFWQKPNAVLIDGGKIHLKTAIRQLKKYTYPTPLIVTALAKRQEKLYTVVYNGKEESLKVNRYFLNKLPQDIAIFFKYLRDESHRFALKQHKKLRKKIS
jgi:excinuclease ABC subunit C